MHDSFHHSPPALEALYQRAPALELSSLDVCFIVALQLRAQELGLASFSEAQLLDVFDQVSRLLCPGTEQTSARATHAIRRLREQRVLVRVDGAGVVRAGEFGLSRLGSALFDFYAEDEVLTRDNLELLAQTLLANLREALAGARQARRPEDWRGRVVGPLRITAGDLILGIERRGRGLDAQQEQFQREISEWLETDWFEAIERCEQLLAETAATLQELGALLLHHTHEFLTVLQEILELASDAREPAAEAVAQRLMGQIDRIAAWGAARQQAWSEYYEHVHRYLRDVVRLDPARALTQRLREQLSGLCESPFALTVADAPAIRVLRSVVPPAPPAPVRRPRGERPAKLEEAPAAPLVDPLEARVRELIDAGALELSEVTRVTTGELPEERRFAGAGKVAELAAKLGRPESGRERPWVPVHPGLVIEDWRISPPDIEP